MIRKCNATQNKQVDYICMLLIGIKSRTKFHNIFYVGSKSMYAWSHEFYPKSIDTKFIFCYLKCAICRSESTSEK